MYEDEPELVGYDPGDGKPLRSPHMMLVMRLIVVLALAGLVLPGIIGEIMLNVRDAAESCKRLVSYEDPGATSSATFQLIGANGTGWQCYTGSDSFGGSQFIASLGWIPGPPSIPSRVPSNA